MSSSVSRIAQSSVKFFSMAARYRSSNSRSLQNLFTRPFNLFFAKIQFSISCGSPSFQRIGASYPTSLSFFSPFVSISTTRWFSEDRQSVWCSVPKYSVSAKRCTAPVSIDRSGSGCLKTRLIRATHARSLGTSGHRASHPSLARIIARNNCRHRRRLARSSARGRDR